MTDTKMSMNTEPKGRPLLFNIGWNAPPYKEEDTNMEFKSEMEITVWEKQCWICGTKNGYITTHHTLPKHLKPIKNFLCPVCKTCHDKLNQNDVQGIVAFAYKIQKSFNELTMMVQNMLIAMKMKEKKE